MLRLALGVVLVIVGVVWILQGFDVAFAPTSFMTGNRWWVWWGLAAGGSGAVLIRIHRR